QPRGVVRGQLPGLRNRPEEAAGGGGRPAAPHQVSEVDGVRLRRPPGRRLTNVLWEGLVRGPGRGYRRPPGSPRARTPPAKTPDPYGPGSRSVNGSDVRRPDGGPSGPNGGPIGPMRMRPSTTSAPRPGARTFTGRRSSSSSSGTISTKAETRWTTETSAA